MELNIDSLAIEVTRKCNMQCEHCLRGPAQRQTIPDHYIYKILQLIDNISILTITGGEPTLAMDKLRHLRHCIIYEDCDVQNFYMVTNGKSINIENLAEWAYDMLNCCSDNEMSQIGFSFDQFHRQTFNWKQAEKQERNFYNLKEKLEYDYGAFDNGAGCDFVNKHSNDSWGYHSLISEGRAKSFGDRGNSISLFEDDQYIDDSVSFNDTTLYLTCSGWLIAGCDWSYQSMDNNKKIQIGHIDNINSTDQLIEAIRAYNKRTERLKQLQLV